jgi:hypothetical protein
MALLEMLSGRSKKGYAKEVQSAAEAPDSERGRERRGHGVGPRGRRRHVSRRGRGFSSDPVARSAEANLIRRRRHAEALGGAHRKIAEWMRN